MGLGPWRPKPPDAEVSSMETEVTQGSDRAVGGENWESWISLQHRQQGGQEVGGQPGGFYRSMESTFQERLWDCGPQMCGWSPGRAGRGRGGAGRGRGRARKYWAVGRVPVT